MPVAALGGMGNPHRVFPVSVFDGRSIKASNTGLNYHGIDPATLVTTGSTTYGSGFNGQTISGKKFTGEVTITGSNITLQDCWMNWGDAPGNGTDIALEVSGSNNTILGCLFGPPSTKAFYVACLVSGGSGNTVKRCDMGFTENGVTCDGGVQSSLLITENYIHDLQGADNDCIEIYAAISGVQILNNWLTQSPAPSNVSNGGAESSINIAPYAGSNSVDHVTSQGNFCDGGIVSTLVDVQSTGTITYTKFVGNFLGGHNNPAVVGIYNALQNNDGRAITHDDAAQAANPGSIQWPNSGPNANYWWACTGLTPDNSGLVINEG
jgi:hypothetical protein